MSAPLPDLLPAPDAAPAVPARKKARGRVSTLRIWLPAGFLLLLAAACFIWPQIYPVPKPVGGSILESGLPPLSPGHILGTDPNGNDVLSRILYGGQVSFEVGFSVTAIGLVIGGLLGMAAGYWRGITDTSIMRVLDVLIAFPALVLALAIAEGLGPSELHVIWALAIFSIPAFGRIARSGTLAILEGALSFLGLGIPLPEPSWGSMIAQGQQVLSATPEQALIPSAFLFATVVSLNVLGDALRERWGVR
jgi:peptide/nickel transport system permease protein